MRPIVKKRLCCCGPCPCVVNDDFSGDTLSLYDVTEGAGFAIASGVLSSTGTGSATRLLEFPGGTRQIGARVALINNSHTSFGLIIGEGDNRIEWVWDTAGTQCTLTVTVAGSAILTQSYAGAPTSTIEVTITGSNGAWDITVSRDGSAVATHSAVAVTFAANWIPVGVASTGGGTWDDLCLISCDPLCVALESSCANGNDFPVVWTLDAGTVTDTVETPASLGHDTLCCSLLSGEWLVVRYDYLYLLARSGIDECAVSDVGTGPLTACVWQSAIQGNETEAAGWCQTGDAVDSRWFMYGVAAYDGPIVDLVADVCDYFLHDENCTTQNYSTVDQPCARAPAWEIELEFRNSNTEVRLIAVGTINVPYMVSAGSNITATYHSPWETVPHDYTVGTTTLSLTSTTPSDYSPDDACSWPSTITATTASRTVAEQVLQCRDRPFCVGLESEVGVLQLRGTIGGEAFVACLSGPAGWSNDGPWSGSLDGSELISTCAGINFSFELFCKTISDTEKAWTLRVIDATNAVTIDLPFEPDAPPGIAGTASGTLTGFCGGNPAFAATVADFTGDPDDPLVACCADPNLAVVCGRDGSINATGSFPTGTCGCDPHTESLSLTTGAILCGGTPIAPTDFDDTANYYRGAWPFGDDVFSFIGWQLLLYCDSGTMRWAALDSANCVQQEGIVTWDCESMTGVATDMNMIGCCMDDIYTAEMTFG